MNPSSLWNLFIAFARANILGFGGGPSVIPFIRQEATENYRWVTQDEFISALALGNTLPGPIATKLAAYIGYRTSGIAGAAVALLGTVAPSAIAMILLFTLLNTFQNHPFVKGMIRGVKPVVWVLFVILVLDYIKFVDTRLTKAFALVAFGLMYVLNLHPIYVIVGAMVAGGYLELRNIG